MEKLGITCVDHATRLLAGRKLGNFWKNRVCKGMLELEVDKTAIDLEFWKNLHFRVAELCGAAAAFFSIWRKEQTIPSQKFRNKNRISGTMFLITLWQPKSSFRGMNCLGNFANTIPTVGDF